MTKRLLAVIVDDEKLARERLVKLLKTYSYKIEVVGQASDGEEGGVLVEALRPDLIFLDIEMPVMNGFEMLQKISYQPQIIFTTAFDQYAIKAFEENSVDYLMKPIEESRLARSIQKLENLEKRIEKNQLTELLSKLVPHEVKSIPVTLGDRITMVKTENIVYFHAEDKYVFVHDRSGAKHIISTTLTTLEGQLGTSFIRVHRAYIINREHVNEIRKSVNGKLTFYMHGANSVRITSSQSYTPHIRKILRL